MVEQDPSNSRLRYMLAMETINNGDLQAGHTVFEQLLAADDTYAAAYFHGAQTLEKLGRIEDARQLYRRGIDVTTRTGDLHTRSELQAALDLLG